MSTDYDDWDHYDHPVPEGYTLCPRCDGNQTVACHCGGDLCVCDNQGERYCPLCGGEYGDEGYVKKEVAEKYLARQREMHAAFQKGWAEAEARTKAATE